MCIRDRYVGGKRCPDLLGVKGVQPGLQVRCEIHGLNPVSYTHLDVYKRQLHGYTHRRAFEGMRGKTEYALIAADYVAFQPVKICN